jgi:hypothetical protein
VICYKKGRAKELWRAQGREQELCLAKWVRFCRGQSEPGVKGQAGIYSLEKR